MGSVNFTHQMASPELSVHDRMIYGGSIVIEYSNASLQ